MIGEFASRLLVAGRVALPSSHDNRESIPRGRAGAFPDAGDLEAR